MNFEGNGWGALIAVLMLAQAVITLWSGRKTRQDVKEVHTIINSQLTKERADRNEQETKLVAATQKAAFLEGQATTKVAEPDKKA